MARIAEREVLAHHRHKHAECRDSRREVGQTPSDSQAVPSPSLDSTPSQRAMRSENKEILDECLAELPVDLREVILLRDYAGASWKHIAAELNRPSPDAARKQHERALAALRSELAGRLGEEPRA
jgi:RNA polymerase sigma factor (sigma-70 family)